MGGLSVATVAGTGAAVTSLLGANSQLEARKKQLKYMSQAQSRSQENRKNLLEEQLASRRARLGSLGVKGSGSSLAVQKRMIDNSYKQTDEDNAKYKSEYSSYEEERQRQLNQQMLSGINFVTDKMIK